MILTKIVVAAAAVAAMVASPVLAKGKSESWDVSDRSGSRGGSDWWNGKDVSEFGHARRRSSFKNYYPRGEEGVSVKKSEKESENFSDNSEKDTESTRRSSRRSGSRRSSGRRHGYYPRGYYGGGRDRYYGKRYNYYPRGYYGSGSEDSTESSYSTNNYAYGRHYYKKY